MTMKKEKLVVPILTACRTELIRLYPGFDLAFAWLSPMISGDIPFGTDGSNLYVSPEIVPMYAESPERVRRGYLHTLLHCLFLHISPPFGTDRDRWDLACDILAEREISRLQQPRLWTDAPRRDAVLALLPEKDCTVSEMLGLLDRLPYPPEELRPLFAFDDHRLWWDGVSPDTVRKWRSLQTGSGSGGSGNRGQTSDGLWEDFTLLQPDPRDYRPLLRKYMVPGEVLETDDESFDYIYYDLGMRQYGNLPLLEPLEYREVNRLDELVIAIDTSSSCDEATVSRFLQETYSILTSQENFFRRMNVVFMQCDCCLQDYVVIHSREEWLHYAWNLKIHGRTGTDFRPVFREIEMLRQNGTLKKPKALLYFTDGDGAWPTEPPDYETVFILAGKHIHPELLPKWAVIREVL